MRYCWRSQWPTCTAKLGCRRHLCFENLNLVTPTSSSSPKASSCEVWARHAGTVHVLPEIAPTESVQDTRRAQHSKQPLLLDAAQGMSCQNARGRRACVRLNQIAHVPCAAAIEQFHARQHNHIIAVLHLFKHFLAFTFKMSATFGDSLLV